MDASNVLASVVSQILASFWGPRHRQQWPEGQGWPSSIPPAFLRCRPLSRSDAAAAVKGAQRDQSHTQPQASMARTSPLTAGGRGGATLFVGWCGGVEGPVFHHRQSVQFL